MVQALVTSRLDYGNVLLHGLPNTTISVLQRVQNTATRIYNTNAKTGSHHTSTPEITLATCGETATIQGATLHLQGPPWFIAELCLRLDSSL